MTNHNNSSMSALATQAHSLLGLNLSPKQTAQFQRLSDLLLDWNQRLNLTSITDPKDIILKHFLDSLTITRAVPQLNALRLIDVGTGAGFPGLPLAIAFPHLSVTLLDSTQKKLRFIDAAKESLNLPNIRTLHGRAEDIGRHSQHRAAYDAVVARAVARLPALMEYLLPLAKIGGQAIAMHGSTAHSDLNTAANAIHTLGGELFAIEEINLPSLHNPRYLIVIDKIKKTPKRYPRQAGTPARDPIL